MSKLSRRRFLSATGSTLPALMLSHYGCGGDDKSDSGRLRDGAGGAGVDTGDSGLDSGDLRDPSLADTGPALPNRWPSSLAVGDELDQDVALNILSGELPEDMLGHVFMAYPVPMPDDDPQLIGDGMVMRLDFEPDGVGLVRRTVRTPCYYADLATRGTDAEFTATGMARMSMTLGVRNSLNTNFLAMGDRLLMTYDGGRPWELDPVSLKPVTPMGAFEEWSSMMPDWVSWLLPWPFPLVLTSAHPVQEPVSGEVFTLNFGQQAAVLPGFTRLIRWDGEGELESWNLVDAEGNNVEILQSAHQIAVTQDYLVFLDVALRMEWEAVLGLDASRAQFPDSTIWIVSRDDLFSSASEVRCTRVTVPRESTHFLVDYLNPGGQITLYTSHNCASDASEFLVPDDINALTGAPVRSDLVGFFASGTDLNALGRYVIDANTGAVVESKTLFDEACMTGMAALYTHKGMEVQDTYGNVYWASPGFSEELRIERVEALYADYPYRTRAIADMPEQTIPGSIFRVDNPTLSLKDQYIFPSGRLPVTPQFVPREDSASDTDGYIVVVVLSDDDSTDGSSGDELWVFDAANLSQGPLTRLGHPDLDLPFTLHSCWMEAIAPRTATYQIRLQDDIGDAVIRQSEEIREMFFGEVFPHFA